MNKKNELLPTYDLSAEISPSLVVYPGDPRYSVEKVCSLEEGQKFNLCHLHLGNHTGTHIDFPAHTIKGGKTSSDFPVDYLKGPGVIIKVPSEEKSVTKEFVCKQKTIRESDIV